MLIAYQWCGSCVAKASITGGADDRRRWLIGICRVASRNTGPYWIRQCRRQQRHIELRVAIPEVADECRRKRVRPRAHHVAAAHCIVAGETRLVASDILVEGVRNHHVRPVDGIAIEERIVGRKLMIEASVATMDVALFDWIGY